MDIVTIFEIFAKTTHFQEKNELIDKLPDEIKGPYLRNDSETMKNKLLAENEYLANETEVVDLNFY